MHLKHLEQFLAHGKYSVNASIRRRPSIEEMGQLVPWAISGEIGVGRGMKRSDWPDLSHIPTLVHWGGQYPNHTESRRSHSQSKDCWADKWHMSTTGPTSGLNLTRT